MSRRDAVVAYLLQPEHGIPLSALDRHDDARRVPLMNEVMATHRGGLAEGRHRRLAPRRHACSGEPSSLTSELPTSIGTTTRRSPTRASSATGGPSPSSSPRARGWGSAR